MNRDELQTKLRNNELDLVEHTRACLEQAQKITDEFFHLNTLASDSALAQAQHIKDNFEKFKDGKLLGVMITAKDSICVKDVESTGGSRILEGYKPVFDATVIEKIKAQGGIVIGKTAQDEFGFGSFSVNVGVGKQIPLNPLDKKRSCGGSSGGAAGFTAHASFDHIALGESTGGSIASPASFCGVYGLTPTYGRVSRYGLMDYGNSLDKVGPMGNTLQDTALLLDVIAGHDENDSTSSKQETDDYSSYLSKDPKELTVGVIKETLAEGTDESVRKKIQDAVQILTDAGVTVKEISLEFPLKYSLATYYVLAMSEASTNLSKYCGMRYGKEEELNGSFNEYFSHVRSEHFGREAKRRIILGTFARMSGYRDAFYLKAAKVRAKIIAEYKKAFGDVDVLLSPSTPVVAPLFSDIDKMTPLQHYMMDTLLVGPNLAGLPHLNIPLHNEGSLPVGLLLTADHFCEGKLIQLAGAFEDQKK